MAMRPFRLFAAAIAGALTLTLAVPAAWAEDTPPEFPPQTSAEPGESTGTLTDRLAGVAESGVTAPDEIARELSLPSEGAGSLNLDASGRVLANIKFDGVASAALIAEIEALATIEELFTFVSAASVRLDPKHLEALRSLDGITSVVPALQPLTSGSWGAVAANSASVSAPISLTAPATTCPTLPTEADAALRTDLARELFGVDGTGVTIGVISDSFALKELPTSWEDDVASGALPGPDNPCGHLTPVEILSDAAKPTSASDEGRAMAQLVHGIAPGAKIVFADSGSGDFGMAQNIYALAQHGADIIVDDITWPTEAYYQKSYISLAIDMVKEQFGVAYFAAAGNSNATGTTGAATGVPLSSWQTTAFRATTCPTWVEVDTTAPFDCLDFDPTVAELAYDTLTIDGEDSLSVLASVGEPLGGVTTAYEVHFYEEAANPAADPTRIGPGISAFGEGLPGLYGSVDVEPNTDVRMVVVRTAHDPTAPLPAFYVGFIRGAEAIASRTFLGDGANDFVGSTTFGHGGDGSALSVASLHWDDPSQVRSYSSLGPNTLLFAPVSLTEPPPSAPLPEPVVIEAPHIASVDGVRTTFFGSPSNNYRFFGTSAAAPIAAAALALGKQYAPSVDNETLTAFMLTAAHTSHLRTGAPTNPYESAGFASSTVFGAGLIDAVGMLELLPTRGFGEPGSYSSTDRSITVSWSDTVGAPTQFTLDLYDDGPVKTRATDGSVAPAAFSTFSATGSLVRSIVLPGTASSHTFTDLQPAHHYSLVLTALLGDGAMAQSVLPMVSTLPLAPPTPPNPSPDLPGDNPDDPGVPPVSDRISQTGGDDITVMVVVAGGLLLLGAVVLAMALLRRRSKR